MEVIDTLLKAGLGALVTFLVQNHRAIFDRLRPAAVLHLTSQHWWRDVGGRLVAVEPGFPIPCQTLTDPDRSLQSYQDIVAHSVDVLVDKPVDVAQVPANNTGAEPEFVQHQPEHIRLFCHYTLSNSSASVSVVLEKLEIEEISFDPPIVADRQCVWLYPVWGRGGNGDVVPAFEFALGLFGRPGYVHEVLGERRLLLRPQGVVAIKIATDLHRGGGYSFRLRISASTLNNTKLRLESNPISYSCLSLALLRTSKVSSFAY